MTAEKNLLAVELSFPCASENYPELRRQRKLRDVSEEAFQRHIAGKKLEALRRIELGAEIVNTVCVAYRIDPSRTYKDEETGADRDLRVDVINEILRLLREHDRP